MGVMSERKKLLWHDYVSLLQCGGGGARLSMQNGREVGNSPGQKRSGGLSQEHIVSPQVDRAGTLWEPFQ